MLKLNRKLPEVYLESYELPNGLTADVYDYSRKLAGDRWLVGLIIRIDVEVTESDFAQFENGKELFERFKEENGNSVTFEMTKERNFIDQQEKDAIFAELLKSIKENTLKYMGHEKLAERFRRKKLAEFIERQNWWK